VQYFFHQLLAPHTRTFIGEEEDIFFNITNSSGPASLGGMVIDDQKILAYIADISGQISAMRSRLSAVPNLYGQLDVVIDPIDGTKEFSSGFGEQCSICIGFTALSATGCRAPVAGLVYRPITDHYAAGSLREKFSVSNIIGRLRSASLPPPPGPRFLTSNGKISPFLATLIAEMGCEHIRSGGVGNKVLMMLEEAGEYYIQDR